ncbi:MAG: glycosyltransferase [Candidatus Cryptobacteroides sp.]
MKRISLVIPMYKVEAYLDRCLRTCLAQDIPEDDYEILAVDDSSPDASALTAGKIAATHPCLRLLKQEHSGLSAARNLGLKNARGRYVWFIDGDDWIEENCLGRILGLAEKQELDILRISAANVSDKGTQRRFSIGDCGARAGRTLVDEGRMQVCAPFSIFRKDFLTDNALSFVEGIYHEDAEFSPRAYYLAERVGALDECLYYVRQTEGSITRSYNPKRSLDYLNAVIPSLSAFSADLSREYRRGFDNLISSNFSNALRNSLTYSAEDRKELDSCAYRQRRYLKHLRRSVVLKYRIEGLVLSLFPRHMCAAYKAMKKFLRR